MIVLDDFSNKIKLKEKYRVVHWFAAPVTPRVIELLDDQRELFAGVIYISTEANAKVYFEEFMPAVYAGALLVVAESVDEINDWNEELTVFATEDKLGSVFNKINSFISLPPELDGSKKLGKVWGQILGDPNLSTGEIRDMFRTLPGIIEPFTQLGIVTFPHAGTKDIPYELVMRRIQALLPNCCGTVRDKELIFLLTYPDRRFDYPFDFKQISAVLEMYDGYMAISNGTRDLSALRIIYYLNKRAIGVAADVNVASGERVLTFERLGMYVIIDMCSKGFQSLTNSDALLYLAHPVVAALKRHDLENNDDLSAVLYYYLINERSIADTASMLHMHRNTVMNKVKKMTSQFKLNFDDRHLRQRLIFSCQLMKFYDEVSARPNFNKDN